MVYKVFPNIEYPATHEFQSKLFNRLVYPAALLSLVILTIANVALVGYESSVALSSDFNATQTFWFHSFIPPPRPGTLCDPHVFNVGETLVTNTSIFDWKILAITRPNAGKSGIAYNGAALDSCDVAQMSFFGDIRTYNLEINAYIACNARDGLEVIATTSLAFSPLPGRRGPILRNLRQASDDVLNTHLMDMFVMATDDAGSRLWNIFQASNRTGTVAVSLEAYTEFCPSSVGFQNGAPLACATDPPQFNLTAANTIDASLDLLQDASFPPSPGPRLVLDDNLRPPITNILHLALAAIRIDLGNPSPNNFLTHPEVLNRTLVDVFPAIGATPSMQSQLFTYLEQQTAVIGSDSGSAFDPFTIPGPAILQAVYVCRLQKRRSAGNLIVTVFVATAGMFTSGWAFFIFLARYIHSTREKAEESEGERSDGAELQPLTTRSTDNIDSKAVEASAFPQKGTPTT
ncbi:hypothetical protein NMY22_g1867 [Coprinellus aureogranulatus]|nr:hypothetical protein NMY22_g1867 [Coprinellus aureogranulatus]